MKKNLENQIRNINKDLKNIYLPHEAVLILLGKRTAFAITLELIDSLQQEQPAEWSEEDKRKLNRIYEILGYAADDKAFLKSKRIIGDKEAIELQDFLKSLRPPFKDREMKLKILKYLSTRCSSLEFEEVEDYLNNLRPSWRPSEEQMDRLFSIVAALRKDYCDDMADFLASLYKQLKKL